MKKILFYTLLIVLFVNCRKIDGNNNEAQKDPIEGTWRAYEVFTDDANTNNKLRCFNQAWRDVHNGSKKYLEFQKNNNGYYNTYSIGAHTGEIRAQATWHKDGDKRYVLSIFPKQTNIPGIGLNFTKPQHKYIAILGCYLNNPKEIICDDWVVEVYSEDLKDCQDKPISNITPTQLQYRFKKD